MLSDLRGSPSLLLIRGLGFGMGPPFPLRDFSGLAHSSIGSSAVAHGIFGASSSFRVKWSTVRKVSFLFFKSFLLILAKPSVWRGDWALGYHSMEFRHFPDTFHFPNFLSLKLFGNW